MARTSRKVILLFLFMMLYLTGTWAAKSRPTGRKLMSWGGLPPTGAEGESISATEVSPTKEDMAIWQIWVWSSLGLFGILGLTIGTLYALGTYAGDAIPSEVLL
eukprot:TRINITY_DN4170_c0_g1::TRINITY_DN4170_c0_g1_i1::g.2201::m.2201 TRINITY_DN4170_c0_g1::TRINITY_DN4170_c0_g1_i1::g.2201  ORF type:complete len:118 (-),score=3.45 TRINITY_DN4170_c0_g1_i1:150-461(-)